MPKKSPMFLKFDRFEIDEKESEKGKNILDLGKSNPKTGFASKKFARKKKRPDKDKIESNIWLLKQEPAHEIINEIVASELFRKFLGEDLSPKYRLTRDEKGELWVASKMLKGYTSPQLIIMPDHKNLVDKFGYYDACKIENERYLKLASEIENFHEMLAISILLGRSDIHMGNWGIIEKDGKKYAASIDHGQAFTKFEEKTFCHLSKYYIHPAKIFLCEKFVTTCRQAISVFDERSAEIEDILQQAVAQLFITFPKEKLSVDYFTDAINHNKNFIKTLCFKIEAEMAIVEGDPHKLRTAFQELRRIGVEPSKNTVILSHQTVNLSLDMYTDSFNKLILSQTPKRVNEPYFAKMLIQEELMHVWNEFAPVGRVASLINKIEVICLKFVLAPLEKTLYCAKHMLDGGLLTSHTVMVSALITTSAVSLALISPEVRKQACDFVWSSAVNLQEIAEGFAYQVHTQAQNFGLVR